MQVPRRQLAGLPQASCHEYCLLGVEMELRAALWPAIADVGEEPWLGLVRKEGSVCSLKSPFFIFLLLHQILLHLCGVRSMPQKPWAQEEWVLGAPSSCAASQPILGSGMAEGKNHKTEQES